MAKLPEGDQLRIIGDLIASNGLPPRTQLDHLDPSQFSPGERRMIIRLAKEGWHPQEDILPLLSPAMMTSVSPVNPDDQGPNYASWSELEDILGSISWEWPGWLAKGFLTMLAASQEMGKSILALRIAACFTQGWPWPDGTAFTGERGYVVWAEGEAGQQLNIQRAKAWGVDLSKVITPHETLDDFRFENEVHREHLWSLMAQPQVRLGIIDSLSGIHGGKESDAEMQRIIKPFAELARDTNKNLLLTHHLNKPPHGQTDVLTLSRVRGSGTITQTARVVWGIDVPDREQADTRRLRIIKSNLGEKPDPVGFTIGVCGIDFCCPPEEYRQESQVDKAVNLLLAWLDDGPQQVAVLQKRIKGHDIPMVTLRRAKSRLKVVSIRREGQWWWGLPLETG